MIRFTFIFFVFAGCLFISADSASAQAAGVNIQRVIHRADRLAEQGRYDEAIVYYRRALLYDRTNKAVWRKFNAANKVIFKEQRRQRAIDEAYRRKQEEQRALKEAIAAAKKAAIAAKESALHSTETTDATTATDGNGKDDGKLDNGKLDNGKLDNDKLNDGKLNDDGSLAKGKSTESSTKDSATDLEAERRGKAAFADESVPEEEQRAFGPNERIYLPEARRGFDSINGKSAKHDVVISSGKYEISNIRIGFGKKALIVRGRLKNTANHAFKYPRIYVKLYDANGGMRGRNVGYVNPARFVLPSRRAKFFEVRFPGYNGTVGSYRIEVVTNL